MDDVSLLDAIGSAQRAARESIADAEGELAKLEILARELAQRLRGAPATVVTSPRAKVDLGAPWPHWPRRYKPKSNP